MYGARGFSERSACGNRAEAVWRLGTIEGPRVSASTLARARARAASLHWNATVRALLLVTTSTFLSVLLIGGLGYVVFQARQIEELRERERDWEARRIEREKLASEIDELARETRLFSERLVARKTSIAA